MREILIMQIKKLVLPCLLANTILFSGCATIVSGTHQDVKVTSADPALNSQLKLVANTDKNRVIKYPTAGGEMDVHRTSKPIEIKIEESECIEASAETYNSNLNPFVILDVLATSLLSTSIDSSTGGAWAYDDTLVVHPKVKNTPDCQKWLADLQEKYKNEHPSVLTTDNANN